MPSILVKNAVSLIITHWLAIQINLNLLKFKQIYTARHPIGAILCHLVI